MAASLPDPLSTLEIEVDLLSSLLAEEDREDRPFLLDCREEDEFAICKIEGAELFPLSQFPLCVQGLLDGDRSRPVVVYCHHGMRSLQATQFLRDRGMGNTFSLGGGIDAWSVAIDSSVARY